MNKIQRVSFFLRVIFQIAFVVLPLMLALYWIFAPQLNLNSMRHHLPIGISCIPDGTEILHPITSADALWGFLIGLLPTVIEMMILYFLIKLFKLYEQGKIFTLSNVEYLKKIGICMLINQGASFIYEALISFALTLHNPAGHHAASVSFGTYDIYNIVTAIMVIVISWIMAEGCKLNEEQQLTV
jgi:hypothetical protein